MGNDDNVDRRQATDGNDGRQTMTTSTYEDEDEAMLMSLAVDALHDCGKMLTDWV